MTHCKNFLVNLLVQRRCVWLNEKCIIKEDHPYYQRNIRVPNNQTDPVIPYTMKRELVDCESINNQENQDKNNLKLECTSFNCKLNDDNDKCLNNIGGSCFIFKRSMS